MIIFMSSLRERLLEAMQDANLTKTDLWKGCGLSSGAITHWFNGSTQTLKGNSLLNAAKVLKVNPIWLNTGKGVKALSTAHPLDAHKKVFDESDEVSQRLILTMLASLKNNKRTTPDDRLHSFELTTKQKQAQN